MRNAVVAALAAATLLAPAALAQQAPSPPAPAPTPPPAQTPPAPGYPPPPYYPPPGYRPYPPMPLSFIKPGLYLRLDGGGAFSANTDFKDTNFATPTLGVGNRLTGDSGSSVLGDVGIGARFLPFFRADVTASYMPSLRFNGGDNLGTGSVNTAKIRSGVVLVNAYFDFPVLTVFGPLQPYFDVGIGAARNKIGTMTSTFIGGSLAGHTETDVAGSLGVGVGIPLGNNILLDLAYKFIDLGEVRTGPVVSATFPGTGPSPIKADLAVHTLTAGLRFVF
jgi:opacity protein-like surface antigen